jgi:hypothetical protein
LHGLIRITIMTIVTAKFVTVISVLIPKKKCLHEQKQDEIAESPCYNKDRIDWLSIGPCERIDILDSRNSNSVSARIDITKRN